ncbi:MAG: hypothetical protein JW388_0032 [Nitrospira sp.]|nr:hypothetical protein [Nitrospira sp.]
MDWTVHRHTFTEAPLHRISALQLRNGTPPPEDRSRVALRFAFFDIPVHQGPHGRKLLKEGLNVFLRLRLGHANIRRQTEWADPIHNPEDDRLGHTSHVSCDLTRGQAENLHSGCHMDILPFGKHRKQARILRQVREDAGLDLTIVGTEQGMARRRDEGFSDSESVLALHRNILQVRLGGGEPSSRCDGLIERGMEPFGLRVHHLRQGIDIGRFELAEAPIVHNLRGQFMLRSELG